MSMRDEKQIEMRNKMMLFGLLFKKIFDEEKGKLLQRLEDANSEITELKKVRNEDAKANEKVVRIIASQKQIWLKERYKFRLQIEALMRELRNMEKRKRKSLSELQERLKEKEGLVQSKDKAIEEEKRKCVELEEKLVKAEKEVQDLRETQERDVQEHSSELWRQKKTFLELASSQRQLEAELSRAHKQIEAKGYELEDLSLEIIKMRKDLEQKDRILAMMLKKSKPDMTEKQTLHREAKTKQDENEAKKWRSNSRKHERRSLRSMFAFEATSKSKTNNVDSITHIEQLESNQDPDVIPEIMDSYSIGELSELGIDGFVKKRENLSFGEEELCIRVIGKNQEIELEGFTENLKLKDEKVEALCLHLMNSELESHRLRSCIEGLSQEMSQLRHNNTKLESLVSRRGEEPVALKKQQFKTQLRSLVSHKNNTSCKRKNTITEPREERESELATDKGRESYSPDELRHLTLKAAQSDAEEESEKESLLPENEFTKRENADGKESASLEKPSITRNPPWRMDLHALGVSFKIKRLKQQLMMLERYIRKQESQETDKSSSETGKRALLLLITLLNKQVTRYQSLQEKIDDLCKRMHVNDSEKISGNIRANGEAKISLEHFLDETFQLQRYIVATGQKLMEIQSKIASGFVEVLVGLISTESSTSSSCFDPERFAESIKSLFQEVQRGLEVRISRIIGDLEGTLAREGMLHLKRRVTWSNEYEKLQNV
ncbi:hypothetical protein EUTSA_v10012800mg [Eutrema salsugineum]|uniref:Uncharacterized protein n=1 Tax=Eutrema salsugineum TaxID=72664 RepID=V4LTK4_EUTSA|nr:golgin subfamily A member 6-like protein 6 [Eutrema salsugineum]XP_024011985.1 golgin subfamily A member 6-like protein 6 [Eutrema salsugineum]ESQ43208.1 hypothetical protein EUTSA_v10012800mg [Eutrema salsugineum]